MGDTCRNVDACLKMDGLIRCTVVPPKRLFHPVLPYRYKKKLLFCLCRSCVHEQNMCEECHHHADAERAIEGTWVIDELRLSLEKGYKILEFHGIYEYRVTQYNPKTGKGGLFVEYINLYLTRPPSALRHLIFPWYERTHWGALRPFKCTVHSCRGLEL